MLGRASWMRLPVIIGVELVGQRKPGITQTDIVLALTEFLRKERVVGTLIWNSSVESLEHVCRRPL